MIQALVLYGDGSGAAVDGFEAVRDAWQQSDTLLWVDAGAPTESELELLSALCGLQPEAVEDCMAGDQRARVDQYDAHLFVLLYAAIGLDDPPRYAPRKVGLFYTPRYLITVHQEPVRAICQLRERSARRPAQLLRHGLEFIFYTLIDTLVDNYLLCAGTYEDLLDDMEERSLQPDASSEILSEQSELRRELIALRRGIVSMRELAVPFTQGAYENFSDVTEDRFRHVLDHITLSLELVEGCREILHAIRDNYHTVLAERANALMRMLTIFATFMLPLSFVAGVYGMNVQTMPSAENPYSFWMVLGGMAALGTAMFVLFRRRKWL